MHYYQHSIGDYRRDTMHLTLLEHGAYRQLIDLYYLNECELNANAMRLVCARNADEVQAVESVLNEFFIKTDAGYKHKRCEAEITKYKDKSDKASASANARWKVKNANAMRTQCEGNANHKPITNNHIYTPPIPQNLFKDYLEVRKAKKAGKFTETAFKQIEKEAAKANLTPIQAIEICCKRAWVGFEKSWLTESDLPAKVRGLQL